MARLIGASRRRGMSRMVLVLGVILGLALAYAIAFGVPLVHALGRL